jgi:hypothetical protein
MTDTVEEPQSLLALTVNFNEVAVQKNTVMRMEAVILVCGMDLFLIAYFLFYQSHFLDRLPIADVAGSLCPVPQFEEAIQICPTMFLACRFTIFSSSVPF